MRKIPAPHFSIAVCNFPQFVRTILGLLHYHDWIVPNRWIKHYPVVQFDVSHM